MIREIKVNLDSVSINDENLIDGMFSLVSSFDESWEKMIITPQKLDVVEDQWTRLQLEMDFMRGFSFRSICPMDESNILFTLSGNTIFRERDLQIVEHIVRLAADTIISHGYKQAIFFDVLRKGFSHNYQLTKEGLRFMDYIAYGRNNIRLYSYYSNSKRIYIGTEDGLFASDNSLRSFYPVYPITEVRAIWVIEPSTVVFGTMKRGLYRSLDNGKSWMRFWSIPFENVGSIVFDKKTNRMFIGTEMGVMVSENEGLSWQLFGEELAFVPISYLDIDNKNRVLAAKSNDGEIFVRSI